jgi:choline dehydrogenase-like flavoprotein
MILDFESPESPVDVDADLCIVGAGAVGIAMALEFVRTRRRVIVVEGGGERPEAVAQRLCESDLRGLPCSSVRDGRARVFGGTTTMWAGQALPLDELDLAPREWIPNSGWPISLSELGPYLRRAEGLMRLPEASYDERGWPPALPQPPAFDGLTRRFSTFTPVPNFSTAHRSQLAAASDIVVLVHANVTELITSSDGSRVEELELRSTAGRRGRARAHRYVLCCGGVENPRLLLASNQIDPRGVGNEYGVVGRFFQEHVHIKVPIVPQRRRRLARRFHTKRLGRVRHYPKLGASAEVQRSERIVNVGGDVCYDVDASRGLRSARAFAAAMRARDRRDAPGALLGALVHLDQLSAAGFRHAVLRQKPSEGSGTMYLCVQTESAPRPDNRVTLGDRVDALGVPRSVVEWHIGEPELRAAEVFAGRVDAGLREKALGHLDLSGFPIQRDLRHLSRRVAAGCHHIGTTRMSDHPQDGVVDRDCRVHGVENLFIAGSSVFPTGGWSNPTLTLLALGYRLADRLKEDLGLSRHTRPRAARVEVSEGLARSGGNGELRVPSTVDGRGRRGP